MSATSRIAILLSTSETNAVEYCNKVRKAFGHSLTYKTIEVFLRRNRDMKPDELARFIRKTSPGLVQLNSRKGRKSVSGIWYPPQKNSLKMAQIAKRAGLDKRKGPSGRSDKLAQNLPSIASPEPKDQNDLTKCSHGVPKVRACAICDPETFRRQHGWD